MPADCELLTCDGKQVARMQGKPDDVRVEVTFHTDHLGVEVEHSALVTRPEGWPFAVVRIRDQKKGDHLRVFSEEPADLRAIASAFQAAAAELGQLQIEAREAREARNRELDKDLKAPDRMVPA